MQALSIYHSDKVFRFKVTVTLTFDPKTSMSSLRAMDEGNVELSLGQAFQVEGHCDLDLRPDDLKINRVLLLVIPNLQVKFEDHRTRHC